MITCPTSGHVGAAPARARAIRADPPIRRHVSSTATPRRVDERVYRRRRTVVGALLAVIVAAGAVAVPEVLAGPGGVPASATGDQPTTHRGSVVARSGDTLWAIARSSHGPIDFDRYLAALVELNGGPSIRAGQTVLLP